MGRTGAVFAMQGPLVGIKCRSQRVSSGCHHVYAARLLLSSASTLVPTIYSTILPSKDEKSGCICAAGQPVRDLILHYHKVLVDCERQ